MGRKKREVTAEEAVQEVRSEAEPQQINFESLRLAKDFKLPLLTAEAGDEFYKNLSKVGAKMESKAIRGNRSKDPFCYKVKINSFTILIDTHRANL